MRLLTCAVIVSLAAACFAPAVAQDGGSLAPLDPLTALGQPAEDQPEPSRSEMLDDLFATLATTDDPRIAERTENRINTVWMASGSDTTDLLMQWAMEAIEAEDLPLALDFLDRIVSLQPDFAEGWNKRATVFFMADDFGKALDDLERVLALEPRHFGALSGLGTVMRAFGDKDRAMDIYRRALALDPHLDSVKEALDELEAEVTGPEA